MDRARESWKRWLRYHTIAGRYSPAQMNAFTSMSQIVNSIRGGKVQISTINKSAAAPVGGAGGSTDPWLRGTFPQGAIGAAAPGGTATTNATVGAANFVNPTNANTARLVHTTSALLVASSAPGTAILIDQLFRVGKTMNSTATEAVTGTFARYQSGTSTAEDYIGGNFCFPSTGNLSLPATAHNWTVCQYTNQASTTGQSFPSVTGVSGAEVSQIDIAIGPGSWFMPLASGDTGVKALTQMQCSALVAAAGTLDFVVAHPIALFPIPDISTTLWVSDGLRTAMEFTRIYDNACLAALRHVSLAAGTNFQLTLTIISE
jgi:hypothetical protein